MNVKSMIKLDGEIASFDEKLFGSSDSLKGIKVLIEVAVKEIEEKRPEMKDKKIEIITDNEDGLVVEKTKEEIEKQLEEVEKVWEFNLSDLEGIGPIKLKKLNSHGIFKAEDLLIRGANELAELLELTPDKTQKMIDDARDYLEKHDVVGKAVIDGLSLLNYRTEKIKYLRTGASNLDEALGGGYETGVITELYGEFGSGKTQFCLVASVLAQLPIKKQCFECHEQFDDSELIRCPKCNVKLETNGGGLSLPNHPCKVLYMDTENSYRSDRVLTIVKELGLDKTKPIGGMTLGHVITHRIYLKKKGNKGIIIAHLVDSPNHAKTEAVLVLTKKGIENGEG